MAGGFLMKRILMFVLLLVVLSAALPAFAQGDPVASVKTGSLNVRTGPGMQYGSIAALPFGFGVNMVARNSAGNWIQIALTNGVTGWVNVNYIFTQYPTNVLPVSDAPVAATVTPTATVVGAFSLNVRNGASTDNAVVTTIPLGTQVVLVGRNYNSTWAFIRLANGVTGWVAANTLDGTVPVRSLALADSVFVPNAPDLPGTPGGNTGNPGNAQFYTVRAGDTLGAIAQQFGVSLYAIAAANNIWNYNLIYADQTLVIPA
jgi:uncharacterized protein YgiM (DUF1202 family)